MFKKWNPFSELDVLRREINKVFEGYAPHAGRLYSAFLPGMSARSYPLVNLSENDEEVKVEALAPGLDPESLEITVKGKQLTITGQKTALEGVQSEQLHRSERSAGKFVRVLDLSTEIDDEKVSAQYINGMLLLQLPKAESAKPRKIKVKVS